MNADTPLHRFDAQERLRELGTQWVDEFIALCETSPRDEAGLSAHLRRLADLEAMEDAAKAAQMSLWETNG